MKSKIVDPRIYKAELRPVAYRVDLLILDDEGAVVSRSEWRLTGDDLDVVQVLRWASGKTDERKASYMIYLELPEIDSVNGPVLVPLTAENHHS